MITCTNLHYRYLSSTSWVIEDFSHTFDTGVTLVKGFSGCGKSTLLRIMGGYIQPTKGSVLINEQKPSWQSYQRRDLGFVFQQLNLLPLASIKRNLQLASSFSRVSRQARQAHLEQYTQQLGIEDLLKKKPSQLSGGQQQRATIARALIKHPSHLLLDEPTSGLDDLNTQVIIKVLKDYVAEHQATVVICTHDQRLDLIANEILDFNEFLPIDRHLQALV